MSRANILFIVRHLDTKIQMWH